MCCLLLMVEVEQAAVDARCYQLLRCCAAERLITPWLPLIRSSHKRVPHVRVTFTTVGAELRSVSATVAELSGAFLARHARLVEEFENPDVWPKHVVVEYFWEQLPDADADAGLFAVLAACASLSPVLHCRVHANKSSNVVLVLRVPWVKQNTGPWGPKPQNHVNLNSIDHCMYIHLSGVR